VALNFTGKTYDNLKFITQVALPAAGTLYFALAGIWGLPSAEEVVGTIVAVDTFLGVVLQISSSKFNEDLVKGVIDVERVEGGGNKFSLNFDGDPREELANAKRAIFEVKEHSS
jgi:hypothetical protein